MASAAQGTSSISASGTRRSPADQRAARTAAGRPRKNRPDTPSDRKEKAPRSKLGQNVRGAEKQPVGPSRPAENPTSTRPANQGAARRGRIVGQESRMDVMSGHGSSFPFFALALLGLPCFPCRACAGRRPNHLPAFVGGELAGVGTASFPRAQGQHVKHPPWFRRPRTRSER